MDDRNFTASNRRVLQSRSVGGKGDHMREPIKIYLLLLVVCVLALVAVWLVPQIPWSLVARVIIKVTLAYLVILFGLWLFGRRHL